MHSKPDNGNKWILTVVDRARPSAPTQTQRYCPSSTMRRHPPAQAPAEACSAFGPIARVDGEMCEVDPAVSDSRSVYFQIFGSASSAPRSGRS